MTDIVYKREYLQFLDVIKSRIQTSRIQAVRTVNRELIGLYWEIGRLITERQEQLGWGKSVVDRLAKDIQGYFPGIRGFSSDNLWRMRQLYIEYTSPEILEQAVPELKKLCMNPNILSKLPYIKQVGSDIGKEQVISVLRQLVAEIPWGHNLLILKRLSSINVRLYYMISTIDFGWSRNVLLNQIKADAYGRQLSEGKQHNFSQTLPEHLAEQAQETLKESYVLDFLGIRGAVLERDLEQRMVEKIRDVIIEFGHGFAFMGNQYRIQVEDKEYFLDLLFYHRRLQCLVAVELKIGAFKPEYAGKMNFYLNLLDDFIKEDHENPSIGIILCAERDRLEVEYSLRNLMRPMGVAQYHLTRELPSDLKNHLPSSEMFMQALQESDE